MIEEITREATEWQAALGLSEECDLEEREKKDDPPQPQHHHSTGQYAKE